MVGESVERLELDAHNPHLSFESNSPPREGFSIYIGVLQWRLFGIKCSVGIIIQDYSL